MKIDSPIVSIIILNWNGWRDTIECLESIYQVTYPNYQVIVVDNNSEDESIQKIKEYCRGKIIVESNFVEYNQKIKPIEIIEFSEQDLENPLIFKEHDIAAGPHKKLIVISNNKNHGFGGGNNIAIRFCIKSILSDYILLLNNDTVVDPQFLIELIRIAELYPNTGFLGPKTFFYNYKGRRDVINFAGGLLDMNKGKSYHIGVNQIDRQQFNQVRDVDYIEGSCMLIKKEVIEKIGFLDSEFFAYWEETDWCLRAVKSGYRLVYVPEAKIWHKESSSTNKISGFKEYYMTRNRFWFMKKNTSKQNFFGFLVYFFVMDFWIRSSIYLFYFRSPKIYVNSFLRGVYDGIMKI